MPDREKVIKGLEYCMGGCQVSCFKCPYRDPGVIPPDCLDNCWILQDAVELLKEQPKWISVKDRLPEEKEHVLIWIKGLCIIIDWIVNGKWVVSDEIVTHWMPLPERPKEDGNESD